ncbi:hypothetical protein B0H17DRAFT_904559, partial [Mycena rosella]
LAKGLCFNCGEGGHLARNCPKNHNVPSKKKGKPPGFATHSVRFESPAASRDALYESTEVLETMHVGGISFALDGVVEGGVPFTKSLDDSEESYELIAESSSPWPGEPEAPARLPGIPPRAHRLGDVLGNTIAALLNFFQPFPGDEQVPWSDDRRDAVRFRVLRYGDENLVIEDNYFDSATVLEMENIRCPAFHMLDWYARRQAQRLGLEYNETLP